MTRKREKKEREREKEENVANVKARHSTNRWFAEPVLLTIRATQQGKKKKTWIFQHTLLSDRHPEEDHRWCAPGEVNPAPAAEPRLFPGFRERECVGVLPVRSPNERRRRRREKEGGTLSDAGRQEGGRHTHTRRMRRTHTVRQCVEAECVKQRLCHSCKKKERKTG